MNAIAMVITLWLSVQVDTLANELLRRRGAVEDEEEAAFIVRGESGALELVHWPRSRGFARRIGKGRCRSGFRGAAAASAADTETPAAEAAAAPRAPWA